jgi:hypothetical protein
MGTAAAVLEQYVQQTLLPQGLPIHIDFQVLLATVPLGWQQCSGRIQIRIRIHVFFGHPDPLVRGFDSGSGSGSGSFYHHAKIIRKILNHSIL